MSNQTGNPVQLIQRAMNSQQAGALDAAEALYRQALSIDPNQFEALHFLGILQAQRGNLVEAEQTVARSIAIGTQRPEAHFNYARILRDLQKLEATAEACRTALRLSPLFPEALVLLGNSLRDLAKFDEAMDCYARAISLRIGYHDALFNRAMVRLLRGQFEQGWPDYEHRFDMSETTAVRPLLRARRWDGEPLQDKSIIVHGEQGFGDVFMALRFLPLLSAGGARVTLLTPPELVRLLDSFRPQIELLSVADNQREFDYQCAIMSLPGKFNAGPAGFAANIPYLKPDESLIARWRERLGDKGFKVGICWQGNAEAKVDRGRSMPLVQFLPLALTPGVRLISLQKGPALAQLRRLPIEMAVELPGADFDAGPDAFVDSAAVMSLCDLVVTVDTSIAHLAGALGRPVWVALKDVPDWRWMLDRPDSPWYPTMRLYRQPERGNWDAVVKRMAEDLRPLAQPLAHEAANR